jgi:hypothetical protein
LVKQTKKALFYPAATMITTGTAVKASGSKIVAGTKKTTVPARKHYSQDSVPEIMSMPEPHGLSPWASMPNITPRAEPGASLQITAPVGWLVTLLLLFVLFYDMLSFVACIR